MFPFPCQWKCEVLSPENKEWNKFIRLLVSKEMSGQNLKTDLIYFMSGMIVHYNVLSVCVHQLQGGYLFFCCPYPLLSIKGCLNYCCLLFIMLPKLYCIVFRVEKTCKQHKHTCGTLSDSPGTL